MRDVVKFREIIEGFSQKDDTFEVRCYLGDLREIISILNRLSAWEERGDTAETPQPNAKDAALAALKAENERLKEEPIRLGFIYDSQNGITDIVPVDEEGEPIDKKVEADGLLKMINDYVQSLVAAEKRERELREKVREFLSCEQIIRNGGLMDNYKDVARARERQGKIMTEWKQLLGGEK